MKSSIICNNKHDKYETNTILHDGYMGIYIKQEAKRSFNRIKKNVDVLWASISFLFGSESLSSLDRKFILQLTDFSLFGSRFASRQTAAMENWDLHSRV